MPITAPLAEPVASRRKQILSWMLTTIAVLTVAAAAEYWLIKVLGDGLIATILVLSAGVIVLTFVLPMLSQRKR